MSSSQYGLERKSGLPKASETATKNSSPYDGNFKQLLIDSGFFPDGYEYPDGRVPPTPDNMDEIERALKRGPLPSLVSDEDCKELRRVESRVDKEAAVASRLVPIMRRGAEDLGCVAEGITFDNLGRLINAPLVAGSPDLYCGARPEQLDAQVRTKLHGHIVPSRRTDRPVLPNFFLEVKGPSGSAEVARRQILYDMSLGARGFHSLREYTAGKPVFDNKAYVIGCTYSAGHLEMYTCHPIPPRTPDGRIEWAMTLVKACSLRDPETARQGIGAFRRAMAWAKQQRDEAITEANEKAAALAAKRSRGSKRTRGNRHETPASPLIFDPDTSEDELACH